MKIIYYNLYEGPTGNRLNGIIKFIGSQHCDILGLSELNNWQNNKFKVLKTFKKETGLKYHTFIQAPSGYNIALFSKLPFKTEYKNDHDFNTGVIKALFKYGKKNFNLILTHLHPKNEDLRLKELDIILKKYNKRTPTIFMGDLNSLSPLDKYNKKELLHKFKKLKITKFGTNKIRTDVIPKIEIRGFIDSLKLANKKTTFTVPTAFNKDPDHFVNLRLDYIFINQLLKKDFKGASVIKNSLTNSISDHFPIDIELFQKSGAIC